MANTEQRISIVLQAIDKVSAPVRAINQRLARILGPARAADRAIKGLAAESGLRRVAQAVGAVGQKFSALRSTVRGVLSIATAATGALAGLGWALKRNADAGDEAVKAAQRFGVTITDWQKLAYAADRAKLSSQDLGAALKFVNKGAVAAAIGNPQAALWFKRAGVDVEDLSGKMKPTRQLLEELADKFAAMPNGAKKTALAIALFGDAGERMIPLLNGGAHALRASGKEAEALGLVNEKLAMQQQAFNSNLVVLKNVARGVTNTIAGALVPVLNQIIPLVKGWFVANRALIATRVQEFVDGLKNVLPQLGAGLVFVFRAVGSVAGAINGAVQTFGGWGTVISAVAGLITGKLIWSILGLAKSIATLGLVTTLTPFGLFMIAIAGIVALIFTFRKALAPLGNAIVDAFAPLGDLFGGLFGLLKELLALIAWAVGPALKAMAIVIGTVLGGAFRVVLKVIKGVIEVLAYAVKLANKFVGAVTPSTVEKKADAIAQSPVAALASGRAQQQVFGGKMQIELLGTPARIRNASTSPGFDMELSSGVATAGR